MKSQRKICLSFHNLFISKFDSIEDQRIFDEVDQLISEQDESLQKIALDYLGKKYKKVRNSMEHLKELLSDKKEIRKMHEKFTLTNIHVTEALIGVLIGILKRTSKERANQQRENRRIIAESCVRLNNQQFLNDLLKELCNEESMMSVDMHLLIIPYLQDKSTATNQLIELTLKIFENE